MTAALKTVPHKAQAEPSNKQPGGNFNYSHFALALCGVLLCALSLYLSLALSWVKFSRAEVFFAECAREMVNQHNYITPLYHGHPFFDKPILVYWLIIGMFQNFGISHLTARIPSIAAALVTATISGAGAAYLSKSRKEIAGLLAAMVTASSFMFLSFAYLCMSDMLLVMFDSITLCLLFLATEAKEAGRGKLFWLASLSMGMAFLTKGPVGLVLPAACYLAFLALTRRLNIIKWPHVLAGAATVLVVSIPWFYAAYLANGTGALVYFFIRENLQRFAGSTYDTHRPVWFMLVSLATGFLPWSCFLPHALISFFRQDKPGKNNPRETDGKLFAWLWLLTVVAFFSVSRGKIDYYALPAYPCAAMLVALYLNDWQTNKAGKVAQTTVLGLSLVFTLAGAAAAFAFVLAPRDLLPISLIQAMSLPAVLLISGAGATVLTIRKLVPQAVTCQFLGICAAGFVFADQILPIMVKTQALDTYALAIKNSPPQSRIALSQNLSHWVDELTFQSGREIETVDGAAALAQILKSNQPSLLVVGDSLAAEAAKSQGLNLNAPPYAIVDRRLVSLHPLTPGYVFKQRGKLGDTVLLTIRKQ